MTHEKVPMILKRAYSILMLAVLASCATVRAQGPDPAVMMEIRKIRAIDNHSHPPRVVADGESDDEFDALPCDPLEPTAPNTMTRPENPQYYAAWRALWGYQYNDRMDAHIKELLAAKNKIRQEQGDHYPAWVLDKLGIETEFANRVAMGRGLDAPRFRWVPFDDALLFPLNNDALGGESPDRKIFFGRETLLLARYRRELAVAAMPATLAEYVSRVVTPELERQKKDGAIAIKFEAAYLRSLDFEPATEHDAAAVYAKFARGGSPAKEEYKRLQDYLFRYVAAEAGRLGLPVHIHTGAGCGGYFYLTGSNPLLLESVLNDPRLRKTTFVLLHGGSGPFTQNISALLMKSNVYTDLSEQTWMESPHRLGEVLRDWLEWYPEKVLFGTDLYPGSGAYDWEEIGWQTSETGRLALGMALTQLLESGQITVVRANEIARMVLRDNATKLYGFEEHPQ
jgi:hypothetical protein